MKKKPFTLLEIMIVICLIGLISSIIGYNMRGSLDQGKAFKTEQAQERVRDLLELELAKGVEVEVLQESYPEHLKALGVVKKVDDLLKDGWGVPFDIKVTDDEITVTSQKYDAYKQKQELTKGKS